MDSSLTTIPIKRKSTREKKLEILKTLPNPTQPSEVEKTLFNIDELKNWIRIAKNKESKSFIDELASNREFNNPENIQKIINYYKIDERESNFPLEIYNPNNIILSPEDYIEGIIQKQNEILMEKNNACQAKAAKVAVNFNNKKKLSK